MGHGVGCFGQRDLGREERSASLRHTTATCWKDSGTVKEVPTGPVSSETNVSTLSLM